jgi:hypothetical protein
MALGALVCVSKAALAHAETPLRSAPDTTRRFALVTVAPARMFTSWWGHSALLVTQPGQPDSLMFEYGVAAPGSRTVGAILLGTLTTRAAVSRAADALSLWRSSGRAVRIQELQLTAAQRAVLFSRLIDDQRPERLISHYNAQANNCSTRIRDVLDVAIGGGLRVAGARALLVSDRSLWYSELPSPLATDVAELFLGDRLDRVGTLWDAAMFPDQLSQLVSESGLDRAAGPTGFTPAPRRRATLPFVPIGLFAGAVLAMLRFIPGAASARVAGAGIVIVGFVVGGLGLIIALLDVTSVYVFLRGNWNVALYNPVLLGLMPAGWALRRDSAWSRRLLRRTLLAYVVLSGVIMAAAAFASSAQDLSHGAMAVVPILLGIASWLAPVYDVRTVSPRRFVAPNASASPFI